MKNKQKELLLEKGVESLPKKPYASPQLTVHGTVEEITKALGSGTKDGLSGSILL